MALTADAMRARYASNTVDTASPARLLTLLYDRLVRDLHVAAAAILGHDVETSHNVLLHAQAIIEELASSLDVDAWDGGPGLAALYEFIHAELVAANVAKDAARIAGCIELVEPLRDAWHQASSEASG